MYKESPGCDTTNPRKISFPSSFLCLGVTHNLGKLGFSSSELASENGSTNTDHMNSLTTQVVGKSHFLLLFLFGYDPYPKKVGVFHLLNWRMNMDL